MQKLENVLASIEKDKSTHDVTTITKVDLSNCGLTELPKELYHLTDSLQVLNLGGNRISSLSDDLAKFKHLKILFFAQNEFESVPTVLGRLGSLNMLSFKSNKLKYIPAEALSPSISWLILTDNQLTELPSSIGKLPKLRKCMLAGNSLPELPEEMQNCKELELLRLSDNKLSKLPKWLLKLPRLSWFAFSGNPLTSSPTLSTLNEAPTGVMDNLPKIDWKDLALENIVGEGASGVVYKAIWNGCLSGSDANSTEEVTDVALKFFKGAMTSDGSPENEMAVISKIGDHPNFIKVFGKLDNCPADHTGGENKTGLVFPLVSSDLFHILGGPPSFETCTRDTFPPTSEGGISTLFTLPYIVHVLSGIASACLHLHETCGLLHGDLYAHNILVQHTNLPTSTQTSSAGLLPPLLTDFGAATFAAKESRGGALTEEEVNSLEKMEVRAFSCLLEDLLDNAVLDGEDAPLANASDDTVFQCTQAKAVQWSASAVMSSLRRLQEECRVMQVEERPRFQQVASTLLDLKSSM